jgi:hypothetical protein
VDAVEAGVMMHGAESVGLVEIPPGCQYTVSLFCVFDLCSFLTMIVVSNAEILDMVSVSKSTEVFTFGLGSMARFSS